MNPTELAIHRANTVAFIGENPSSIVLIPRTMVKTGTGTSYQDGTPRQAQTFRLIDQTRNFGPEPGTAVGGDGKQRKIEYQLLGAWDATIGLWDYWVDSNGIKWQVIDLMPDQDYERRAQVVRYGES